MILAEHQQHGLIDLRRPVNRRHWAARGLVAWCKVLPGWFGGRQWFNVAGLNHGTLTNMAAGAGWSSKPPPGGYGSLDFNPSSPDYVQLGSLPAMAGNGDFTWSLWTLVRDDTRDNDLIVKGNHAGGAPLIFWYDIAAVDHWNFLITDTGGTSTGTKSSADVASDHLNRWVNLTLVLRGGVSARLYVNGVEDANSPFATTVAGISTASEYRLGTSGLLQSANALDGLMDDVAGWDRALSSVEARAWFDLCRRGSPGLLNRVPLRAFGFSGSAELIAPENLAATAIDEFRIALLWDDTNEDPENETGTEIERSLDEIDWTLIHTADADETTYTDTGLSPATEYFYRVRAVDATRQSEYSNTASATTSPRRDTPYRPLVGGARTAYRPLTAGGAEDYRPGRPGSSAERRLRPDGRAR